MGKRILFLMILPALVFALAGMAQAWQGRMGGMGDPYGLVADEADFLTHPAKIAKGEGVRFYGDYRFTYNGVTDWDFTLDRFNAAAGTLVDNYHFDTSGDEYRHNALVGAAFPVWLGRMGAFFTYDGMRGDYDGDEDHFGAYYASYDLDKGLDNFALRLLYGLPVWGVDVGLELGMAYRDEQQKTWILGVQNYPWSFGGYNASLFPLMIPYDSQYWELLWRAGTELKLLPVTIAISLRGGYIICSDNEYHYRTDSPAYNGDLEGDVSGWRIGSDIWVRVPGGDPTVTFPILFSFDYAEKKRDGEAIGAGASDPGQLYRYTHREHSFDLKAGGGIEKKLGGNALIAGGIYYNYLEGSDDFDFTRDTRSTQTDDLPFAKEHRVLLRLAGEKELSPTVTLRMGLNGFFGWVMEDFQDEAYLPAVFDWQDAISLDGSHWGIGASLGGTIKIPPITLEPFINFNYQQTKLDGDGERFEAGTITDLWEMDKSRNEWSIGGGLSILFNLP